jgi:hypothetical protein
MARSQNSGKEKTATDRLQQTKQLALLYEDKPRVVGDVRGLQAIEDRNS